jgi:predicted nucleic acid-binding protein
LKTIYLDVCTLCRPYYDQSSLRIHQETVAVHLILEAVQAGYYSLARSPVHKREIEAIPNRLERIELLMLLEESTFTPNLEITQVRIRAEDFVGFGLGVADAAHLAFAESMKADFISCDDKLLKKCSKLSLDIWTGSPISFCEKENLQ